MIKIKNYIDNNVYYVKWVFPTSFRLNSSIRIAGLLCAVLLGAFNRDLVLAQLSPGVNSPSTGYTGNSTEIRAIDASRLADAIFRAENSKRYPYGIIAPYCTAKTPAKCRKGCLQTIEKRYRMWVGTNPTTRDAQAFIEYLSRSYAPLNAKNDPTGLNRNWIKNVRWFYEIRSVDSGKDKVVGHA